MTDIAFIGLGIMGAPMARNLLAAGHQVTGYSLGTAQVEQLVSDGGRAASSGAEAVVGAEVIITMLPDSPDVQAAALGEDGFLASATPGALWIDCSSINPAAARSLAVAAAERGVRALDAPVSGGEIGAIEGTMSIMVGGDAADFEEARPLLDVVGGTVVHVGPSGAGQTVKAANQLIVGGTIELVAEALVFLGAYGVDLDSAIEVLAGGLAGNRILDLKAKNMVAGEFAPGFRIDLHHKDMGNVVAAAREAGVAIPLGALTAQLIGALRAQGDGGLDHSALMLGVERLSGISR